jgi:prephenate dehydratase
MDMIGKYKNVTKALISSETIKIMFRTLNHINISHNVIPIENILSTKINQFLSLIENEAI